MSKIKDIGKRLQTFIKSNSKAIKLYSSVSGISLLVLNVSFFGLGLVQSVGGTPHYYCDKNARAEIKSTLLYRQYCTNGSSRVNNETIASAAVTLATTDTSLGTTQIEFNTDGLSDVEAYRNKEGYTVETFIEVLPKIMETAGKLVSEGKRDRSRHTWSPLPPNTYYASCDLQVSSAILWSGADDNFPMYLSGVENTGGGTSGITGYLINDGGDGKWEELQRGEPIQPGDIALGNGPAYGHVWMYVANWENGQWTDNSIVQEKFPGSTSNRYEGSHRDYYAKLSHDEDPWESSERIFRYIGEVDENSEFKKIEVDS